MHNGFFRVAAAAPRVNVADVDYNVTQTIDMLGQLSAQGVELAVFPELGVTAYTCGDLFHQRTLLDAASRGIAQLADVTRHSSVTIVVGAPVEVENGLFNCAVAIAAGKVLAIVPKTYLPNYNEFYEKRWFESPAHGGTKRIEYAGFDDIPFGTGIMIDVHGVKVAVELCEDMWTAMPPSGYATLAGADVVVNLSASDDLIGKYDYLISLVKQQSARCICAYVYAGAGYGESSTDLVFDGKAFVAENGTMLAANRRWSSEPELSIADIDIEALRRDRLHSTSWADCAKRHKSEFEIVKSCASPTVDDGELLRTIDPHPFVPANENDITARCEEIINIQVAGLARRLDATRTRTLVVGISGGLDSTLALLVAARTFDRLGIDRKGILGVTMPGFGTTDRTYNNAIDLMKALGVTIREISIVAAVNQHFADIDHDPAVHDVTYENSQARERTQLLMDIANQCSGMVLGTGDLSELALGWATYNGDHMSMYGVNAGVPKTLVKYLVRWEAGQYSDNAAGHVLTDILDTPISPELLPADDQGHIKQRTEDLVGPYELHDFFLYYLLRYGFTPRRIYFMACKAFAGIYDSEVIKKWLREFSRRFFTQQFKRSCLPDGPKVGSVCLSPRGDWRMPSDASSALWLKEIDEL